MDPSSRFGELGAFLGASVLPATQRTYDGHWHLWTAFLHAESYGRNPYLIDVPEATKTALVGLFLFRRYQAGARGKAAYSVTSGIRMRFAQKLLSTEFLESPVIHTARSACRLSPRELRSRRDAAALNTSVKLPICEGILVAMRVRLWVETPWFLSVPPGCLAYIGCMWGYDQSARVSEYTTPENGAEDHCIRIDDLTFVMVTGEGIVGSALAAKLTLGHNEVADHITSNPNQAAPWASITECRALAASSKGKRVTKAKLIARRSAIESQFLDDLARFVILSGSRSGDELFSFRKEGGAKLCLRARTVRQELKNQCSLQGLPPDHFSSHSLRKGAITHMRATGASEDDRRDRGGYADGSQLIHTTYNYATGLGPLAASGLEDAVVPGLIDVLRLIPARAQAQEDLRANPLGR